MRTPDFVVYLHIPTQGGGTFTAHKVSLWMATDQEVGPQEYAGYLQIDGLEGYDVAVPVPGAFPFQATMLTFVRLFLVEQKELGRLVWPDQSLPSETS